MESAHGHFVSIADLPVQCIVYPTDEEPFCLIDIIGYGLYRARPMRKPETAQELQYHNYLIIKDEYYALTDHIPPD